MNYKVKIERETLEKGKEMQKAEFSSFEKAFAYFKGTISNFKKEVSNNDWENHSKQHIVLWEETKDYFAYNDEAKCVQFETSLIEVKKWV